MMSSCVEERTFQVSFNCSNKSTYILHKRVWLACLSEFDTGLICFTGHPFKVTVKDVPGTDAEISAASLQAGICDLSPQTFTFDSRETGKVLEAVAVITPQGGTLTAVKDF